MLELWDTSALIVAARHDDARRAYAEALASDEVATTEPIILEFLNGARNIDEYDRWQAGLRALPRIEASSTDWQRALDVHRLLAASGAAHQRSVRLVDLVIAAVAERVGLPVVHVDADYERIARITGQPVRRFPWAA